MMIGVVSSQSAIGCAFPLNMPEDVVVTLPFGATGRPTMTDSYQTASYTLAGDPGSNVNLYALPADANTGGGWRLDLSSGLKVIEFPITFPAPAVAGSPLGVVAFRAEFTISTILGSNRAKWTVDGFDDGAINIDLRCTGDIALQLVDTTAPSRIAIIFDCDAGTLAYRINDVEQVLVNDAFTPGEYIGFVEISEFTASPAGNSGGDVVVGFVTNSDEMTGDYTDGETDVCGNEL